MIKFLKAVNYNYGSNNELWRKETKYTYYGILSLIHCFSLPGIGFSDRTVSNNLAGCTCMMTWDF